MLKQLSCVIQGCGRETSPPQCWSNYATHCKEARAEPVSPHASIQSEGWRDESHARSLAPYSHICQPYRSVKELRKPAYPCFLPDESSPGNCTPLSPSTAMVQGSLSVPISAGWLCLKFPNSTCRKTINLEGV